MTDRSIYPCGRLSRRHFLHHAAGAFVGGAWVRCGRQTANWTRGWRFKPKAKSVIFLFMCGGVSHIDTFDPKGNKYAGKMIDAIGFGDNVAEMKRPVIPCLRTFTNYGKSGIPVSDWFPNVGGVIDDIAVVRSMWCHEGNHFPAVIETQTGHRGRAVRSSVVWQLGHLRAGDCKQEPPRLREYRTSFVAGAAYGRISGSDRRGHTVPDRAIRRSQISSRRRSGNAAEREQADADA